jgi:hypothetical protein
LKNCKQKMQLRNELLEQTVEKGIIALQQQEEELKRARARAPTRMPGTHRDFCCTAAAQPISWRGGGAVLGALPDWTYQDYTAQLQPGTNCWFQRTRSRKLRIPNSKSSATSV